MELKETLDILCQYLESTLNMMEKEEDKHKVEFILINKPNIDYKQYWTIRIDIDDVCIIQENYRSKGENEDVNIIEHILSEKLLYNIFQYGIMSMKKDLESLKQHKQ